MPKAFSTFHDQCPVHIRVLTMFTGTFSVKGGGLFRTTPFCFLTVVFSAVVALLGINKTNRCLTATQAKAVLGLFYRKYGKKRFYNYFTDAHVRLGFLAISFLNI